MFKEKYVENLPDAYNKETSGNNHKILSLEQEAQAAIKTDIADIFKSLDLEQATGETLDLYGKIYSAVRGNLNDKQYRILLKTRINQNMISGSYDSVLDSVCRIFNCTPNEFYMQENEEPCSVKITKIPFGSLNYVGLTGDEAIELIKTLIPTGITVTSASFEGTFEFAASEDVQDNSKGFAISEADQSIGGYFGYVADYE